VTGPRVGRVALVGAGPGDPALLTLRAAELLRTADVVAHDELVSESVLAMVPARAELVSVGRRAGGGHTDYRLHPLVIERAREGKLVVRLKAGDPLVFGRGGEEAQELVSAGIPFEIVPGISAALGAAAYAGIPLTHRDCSAQVVVASGHRVDGGLPPPGAGTGRSLALYMVSHELARNLQALVSAGWAPATPAALVVAATTAEERVVVGTLETLPRRVEEAQLAGTPLPSLVIVGQVVTVRGAIDWRARLPLRGRRIIVARAHTGPSSAAAALRTLGADVVELPHVERELGAERVVVSEEHRAAPARWPSRVDLVVLPAASAASALYGEAPAHIRGAPAVAIGAGTEEAARRWGVGLVLRAPADTVQALVDAARAALSTSDAARAVAGAVRARAES
jgi:uroporphyrinogen III methyltransferase/synthase